MYVHANRLMNIFWKWCRKYVKRKLENVIVSVILPFIKLSCDCLGKLAFVCHLEIL